MATIKNEEGFTASAKRLEVQGIEAPIESRQDLHAAIDEQRRNLGELAQSQETLDNHAIQTAKQGMKNVNNQSTFSLGKMNETNLGSDSDFNKSEANGDDDDSAN